ncbi:MAG: hypothetical protein JWO74_1583 [Solirubrobacterales bacterium]|nr:hypothetical protein [Solirubrobacterales bacterium]
MPPSAREDGASSNPAPPRSLTCQIGVWAPWTSSPPVERVAAQRAEPPWALHALEQVDEVTFVAEALLQERHLLRPRLGMADEVVHRRQAPRHRAEEVSQDRGGLVVERRDVGGRRGRPRVKPGGGGVERRDETLDQVGARPGRREAGQIAKGALEALGVGARPFQHLREPADAVGQLLGVGAGGLEAAHDVPRRVLHPARRRAASHDDRHKRLAQRVGGVLGPTGSEPAPLRCMAALSRKLSARAPCSPRRRSAVRSGSLGDVARIGEHGVTRPRRR